MNLMNRNTPRGGLKRPNEKEEAMRIGVKCVMLAHHVQEYVAQQWRVVTAASKGRSDRGSVTIEQVIWAVAVIAIVAIVVTAITNYVTTKAGQIK